MNAKVTYEMHFRPHPWNDKRRAEGTKAWCLCEVTQPEMGPPTFAEVAVFNLDSEAERFQAHVLASKLDGALVKIDPTVRELFELQAKARVRLPRDKAEAWSRATGEGCGLTKPTTSGGLK